MPASKEEVKLRSTAGWTGVALGCAAFIIVRLLPSDGLGLTGRPHSLPYISASAHWPAFFRGFWPLDLAASCLFATLAVYLLLRVIMVVESDADVPAYKLVVGTYAGIGSLCGVMGSGSKGWLGGTELFLLGGLAVIVCCGVVLVVLLAASRGFSWLLDQIIRFCLWFVDTPVGRRFIRPAQASSNGNSLDPRSSNKGM